ncbi:PucR family transcriptional regulator [Kocuria sp. CPCC 205292]|uniref:PucR family transcriptional regulator n=1 Tax=Kocuria cellulosilytica TaxID=3071451 RepID=UPI0034D727A1
MVTVAQVLGLPGLGLEPVVGAATDLPVSWVVTSELADPTPYLEGGEVLLLTGIHTSARAHSWTEYVRRLTDRGVVALGLGVGERLSYPDVPDALAAACRDAGLTLFRVPERTPFLGIIRAAAEMRAAEARTALEAMLSEQRSLTRAAVGRNGPARVVRTLVAVLGGGWAGVCAADARIVERSGPGLPALPSGRTLPELLDRLRPAGLRGSLSESGPEGAVVVHPLGVDGVPQSYLVVALPGPADPVRTGVIATAVALLSLHAERAAEQALFRRRVRAGALALLLNGEARSADALLGVADDTTWSAVPRVRVARLRGGAEALRDGVRRLEAATGPGERPVLVGAPATEPSGEQTAALLLEDLPERLAEVRAAAEASGLRAGIGGPSTVRGTDASDRGAREALERTTDRRPVGTWDDLVAGGVADLLPRETARAWAQQLLQPLERGGRSGLLRTFLAHNGNRSAAADALGIHRNTLQQRLQEIETALGRSVDDPQLRAELWLALRLADRPDPSAP